MPHLLDTVLFNPPQEVSSKRIPESPQSFRQNPHRYKTVNPMFKALSFIA